MREKIKALLTVIAGTIFAAIALDVFLAPSDIAPGGLSGLSVVLNHLTRLPIGFLILILNVPVIIWGLMHFNKRYMVCSLIGMFLLSLFVEVFAFLPKITEDILLSAVYGGGLMGLGIGLVFGSGWTTGGTDIVAQILKKKFPTISVGRFVLIIDAFVIAVAGITFGKWEVLLYSAIALYISSFIIDIIAEGGNAAKVAYIISKQQKEIATAISQRLDRGTTLLNGWSFYSDEEKTVLLCVVRKYEVPQLKNIIKETDKSAFVIVSDAREVLGNGFNSY